MSRLDLHVLAPTIVTVLLAVAPTHGAPIQHARTIPETDWVAAGVGGVGPGSGSITISGVTGPVTHAFFYWHGIDFEGAYEDATVVFEGTQVTGTSLGDATTNCWTEPGIGSSRAFRADVTALVAGNGTYSFSGLVGDIDENVNGASLVVLFDDGSPGNDRDLVFFEGNDSDVLQAPFPGETPGWEATLGSIDYGGGAVNAQFHVADGQLFLGGLDDDTVTFSTGAGSVTIEDASGLWDGTSVPSEGNGRTPPQPQEGSGALWDIHTFDITAAFGPTGPTTLAMTGMEAPFDCHSLVVLLLDLEPGTAPPAGPVFDVPPTPECGSMLEVDVDATLTFTVQASHPDPGEAVTLGVSGLPPGAVLTPGLPLAGNPVATVFTWTPTAADANTTHLVTFTAVDEEGLGSDDPCTFSIRVGDDLLVVLTSFEAVPAQGEVELRWTTELEVDNAGFYLLRRNLATGLVERIPEGLALIPAAGDVQQGAQYARHDTAVTNGVPYGYTLVDVDLSGTETRHGPVLAVPNPVDPPIRLIAPPYGERLSRGSTPLFRWRSDAPGAAGVLQISADPLFPVRSTLAVRVTSGPDGLGERQLPPVAARRAERMARRAPALYWRIVEGSRTSQTWWLDLAEGVGSRMPVLGRSAKRPGVH